MSLILSTCISLSGGLSIGPWCDGALPPSSAPPLSPSSHTPYLGSQGCVPGYFGCSWARAPADEAPHLRTHSERPQTPTHPPCTRRSRPDLRSGATRATDAVGVVAGRAHGAVRTRLLVLQEACEAGLARRAAHFVLILATRACCGGGGMRGRVGRWVGRGARVRCVLAGLAIACHHRTVERGWGGMSAQGHAGRRRTDRPQVRGGF